MKNRIILFLGAALLASVSIAQTNEVKFFLNKEKNNYVKLTGLAQMWLRHTDMNPGSLVNGEAVDQYADISIRRLRFQVIAQLTDRVFFYAQFGQNNFNFHSPKYEGAFFHDAVVEYEVIDDNKLSVGTGLTGWGGLARYASPSIGTIMTLDAPLYQQVTNGATDQFIRKLSVYAKGQLGKLDYRVAVAQPMSVTGLTSSDNEPVDVNFSFANGAARKQFHGYFKYMFLDRESNLTPYQAGTYFGKKRVFNLGVGIIYQQDAMWARSGFFNPVTRYEDMVLLGADLFYDAPVSENQAITLYGAYTNFDFGAGYFRNVGVDNSATGTSGNPGGPGNAFPMVGTGSTFYGQAGYLLKGKYQPFISAQYSEYDFSKDNMLMYEIGANLLTHGTHGSKLSFMYQNRPTYQFDNSMDIVSDGRKGMLVLQYQVTF